MSFLQIFFVGFIDTASAALDQWGASNQGVANMWQTIRNTVYTNQDPIEGISGAVVSSLFPMIGGVAVILVIYAGIKMITAQGKEDQISKAKTIIYYALLAVILGVLATTLVGFIIDTVVPMVFGG